MSYQSCQLNTSESVTTIESVFIYYIYQSYRTIKVAHFIALEETSVVSNTSKLIEMGGRVHFLVSPLVLSSSTSALN